MKRRNKTTGELKIPLPALTGRTGGGKTVGQMFIRMSEIGRDRICVGQEAGGQFELSEGFQ